MLFLPHVQIYLRMFIYVFAVIQQITFCIADGDKEH